MIRTRDFRLMSNEIRLLGTALFSNYSMAILKIPNCLVTRVKIDGDRYINFSIKRKYEDMNGFDIQFPAHMHFFNKDVDYYIEAAGIANIEMDDQEVLVRFEVVNAKYFNSRGKERSRRKLHNLLKDLFYSFIDYLVPPKLVRGPYVYAMGRDLAAQQTFGNLISGILSLSTNHSKWVNTWS